MRVDAHVSMEPHRPSPSGAVATLMPAATANDLVAALDRFSIDKACLFAPRVPGQDGFDINYHEGNAVVARIVASHPDRFVGFARVYGNGYNEATNEFIRCRDEYGFRGAMLNGDWEFVNIGADYFDPYLLMCDAWGWPVYLHTGSYPECEPGLVIPVAERFPNLNLILGHLGYDMIFDAITAATLCPNVYLETSANAPAAAIQEAIKRCGAHKLIFGSGLPYEYPDHAAEKIVQLADLSDADREAIFGGTMLELLSRVRE